MPRAAMAARADRCPAAAPESTTQGNRANAYTSEFGGAGGRGSGAGHHGGAGGVASGAVASATGVNVNLRAYEAGGAGGRGYNGADGGIGASTSLTDALTG